MPGRPNNTAVVDSCAQRLRSLERYVDRTETIAINGRKVAVAEVRAIYQECLDARTELARQRAAARVAMARRATAEGARREAEQALRGWVANEFGRESSEAIDFGFPPPKKGMMTVETKARAVARRKATREARHTMGKKQKEGVRGEVAAAGAGAPEAGEVAAATGVEVRVV